MRIAQSSEGSPMLLDSRAALVDLHDKLQAVLSSASIELELRAEQDGDPSPYQVFLPGLVVRKTDGPILLSQSQAHGWLSLQGSVQNLRRYVSYFYFGPGQEGGHHHPENCDLPGYLSSSSMSLIIEADSRWGEGDA
jgi:hypothetical protein